MPLFDFNVAGGSNSTGATPSLTFTDSGVTFVFSATNGGLGSVGVSRPSGNGTLFAFNSSGTSPAVTLDVNGVSQTQFSGTSAAPVVIDFGLVSGTWNVTFHFQNTGTGTPAPIVQAVANGGSASAVGQFSHITFTPSANFDLITLNSITATVNCFLEGTLIAGPDGDKAVETLQPGDTLITADGGVTEVKWVARQQMFPKFSQPEEINPVLIKAGALAENVPARDLYVTTDHAMLVDGMLITAAALVNGRSICKVAEMPLDGFSYYHIETGVHEAILAENAAAETLYDYSERQVFDNEAEYAELHADAPAIAEMDLPRITAPRMVPAALVQHLEERADLLDAQGRRRAA